MEIVIKMRKLLRMAFNGDVVNYLDGDNVCVADFAIVSAEDNIFLTLIL